MPAGKYERKTTSCPTCGKEVKNLKLHLSYCSRSSPSKDTAEGLNPPSEAPAVSATDSEVEFIDSAEPGLPAVDKTVLDGLREKAEELGRKLKSSADAVPIMKQAEFRDLLKLTDKLIDFLELPDAYKLTEEELDDIVPDLYYLMRKYTPWLLQWMRHDLIVVIRLTLNIAKVVKSRVIMYKLMTGQIKPEDVPKEMQGLVGSEELKQMGSFIKDFSANIKGLTAKLQEEKAKGTLPSQKVESKTEGSA